MPGFWRNCGIAFRWLRFAVWAVVLAVLLAFAWFNLIGLPDFLKTRLVATLQARGVQLEFSRMRLRLVHGLVAENVRLGQTLAAGRPTLTAREVQLRLDYPALLHRRFQLDGIVLHDGKLTLPQSATNSLVLFNLQTELRFGTNDTWSLDHFHADFAGVKITLAGEIEHAPEMQGWKLFAGGKIGGLAGGPGVIKPLLQQIYDTLAQIHFVRPPQLNVTVNGDARDVHSFIVRLNATAPGARTPWFSAGGLQFGANLAVPADAPTNRDPALAWWTSLQPFRLAWIARAQALTAANVNADAVEVNGFWRTPELAVTRCFAQLGGGNLNFGATLDVATRELIFTNDAGFDPHALAPLLPKNARDWLAEISWKRPPVMHVSGSFRMPEWTNQTPDWRAELQTTANGRGEIAFTNAVFRGAPTDLLRTHFAYANQILSVADFSLTQGRTRLELDGEQSLATKNFNFALRGTLAAASVEPFLPNDLARHGFGLMHFTEPLALNLAGSGNLRDFSRFAATGHVALTNFAIRAETVDSVVTEVSYTNLLVNFLQPHILRAGGKQTGTADNVALNLAKLNLYITNGISTLALSAVGHAIGPKTGRDMDPYEFLSLPLAHVDGCIPVHSVNDDLVVDDADLRVEVIGTVPFRWHKFETPRINGTVHWLGKMLLVSNVVADAYGGTAEGWGSFNLLTPGPGTDLSFFARGTNVDFHAMGRALWSPTNALEGALSGWVEVTHANSDNWRSWNGAGAARLHDGLLWDIPVVGLASPVLNTFWPGLGNSRATEATAQCTMTNGVIYTDSLEIRSLLMRLQYVGTVDLQENVNAKVTAQLLRNTWGVGPLMSLVLWPVSKIFECQVTGTLGDPKAKPVLLIPRLLIAPLHPIRTVEEIFTSPATNNPAAKP
jgi:hypothetical protein